MAEFPKIGTVFQSVHPNCKRGLHAILSEDKSRVVWTDSVFSGDTRVYFPARYCGRWCVIQYDTGEIMSTFYSSLDEAVSVASKLMECSVENSQNLLYSVGLGNQELGIIWSCRPIVCSVDNTEDIISAVQESLAVMGFSPQTRSSEVCRIALEHICFVDDNNKQAVIDYYAKNARCFFGRKKYVR